MVNIFSNKIRRNKLAPGDHIYSYRILKSYAHHGIYMGSNRVIHFTGGVNIDAHGLVQGLLPNASGAASSVKGKEKKVCASCTTFQKGRRNDKGVIVTCLDCFLAGRSLYLFAYSVSSEFFKFKLRGGTCTLAPSDPPEDVQHRAQYLLDNGFGTYNLFKHNCEDFALYCKTGLVPKSDESVTSGQAIGFGASKASVQNSGGTLNFIASALVYMDLRYKNDMGVREDVVKMPVEEFVRKYAKAGEEGETSHSDD